MSPNIVQLQQAIIDQELLEMPATEINAILETMNVQEAMNFLGQLNRVRARAIYLQVDVQSSALPLRGPGQWRPGPQATT